MKESIYSKDLDRPKLTRERIVLVAMEVAQTQGLEAVSMRKVASLLDVEAMSLYRYIKNKDDLLDGVIEHITSKIDLPPETLTWREAIFKRAQSEHENLSSHAWIINLLEARSGTGAVRLAHQNHMIGILRRAGFSVELAFQTMIIVTGFVYGFVVFATAWSPGSVERAKTKKKAQKEITSIDHPYVLEAINFAQSRAKNSSQKTPLEFEVGLNLILDGIESRRAHAVRT